MDNGNRWLIFALCALLLAAGVGFWAFQAGTAHGIEQSGKIVVAPPPAAGAYPYPYPYYGWHRPWGSGFFFGPIFFIAFWLILFRGLFWRRRAWYGGYGGYGPGCGPYGRFEEWHRQAHEREREASAGGAGER
jgi:hypothetical protein